MLKLDLIFSGLGITKRDDIYLSRSIASFGDLLDSINGLPLVLEHPKDLETNEKSLLYSNTDYTILGYIEGVNSITEDCIRVDVNIIDPRFIDFYESLTDEQKASLHISPAVNSDITDPIEVDGKKIFKEVINRLDHLAIVSNGYWMRYIDDQPVKDMEKVEEVIEEGSMENIDFIGSVPSTAAISEPTEENMLDEDQKIQHYINSSDNKENSMAENIEEKVNEIIEHEGKEAETYEEMAKEHEELVDSDETSKEEEKVDSEEVEEEIKEEKIDEAVEEIKEEEKIDSECEEASEEIKIDSEEEVKKVEEEKIDEEEIKEEEEVIDEDDEEMKEEVVKIVGNLVDSVEGFRKAKFNSKESASTYVKKTLNLNKQFIDKKYHSLIDSIDSSSLEFGKDLLLNIRPEAKKAVSKNKYEYIKIKDGHYRRDFF